MLADRAGEVKLTPSAFRAVFTALAVALVIHSTSSSPHRIACADEDVDDTARSLEERVNAAIDRASCWLEKRMQQDGRFCGPRQYDPFGHDMLCTLALLHGRDALPAPWVARSLRMIKGRYRSHRSTYASSLCLLVLAALQEQSQRGRGEEWSAELLAQRRMPRWTRRAAGELCDWLLRSREPLIMWRYGQPGAGWDISNTQYACMGLLAAKQLGASIDEDALMRMLQAVLGVQDGVGQEGEETGARRARARGFRYQNKPDECCTGSTTAGGLAALGALHGILRLGDPHARPSSSLTAAIDDGFAWLAEKFTVKGNPVRFLSSESGGAGFSPMPSGMGIGTSLWHAYYLYALERACALCDRDLVGSHDWYREAATFLVESQSPDGSWDLSAGLPPGRAYEALLTDTSFALLVLRRSTERLLPPSMGTPPPPAPVTTPR